jgi:glycine dehydrogenase subunit 1
LRSRALVIHPWLPNSPDDIKKEMLKIIGVNNIEELFSDIPEEIRVNKKWESFEIGLGRPLSELEIDRIMNELLSKNRIFTRPPPFLGGGAWPHHIPYLVRYIIERSEFLTSYTPYQAEASQGVLQALFEYQSLLAELLEMDVVNASMYEGASALSEALLMSLRVFKGKKNEIVVPETLNPQYKDTIRSYLYPHKNVNLKEVHVNRETGYIDLTDLENKITERTAAAVFEYPSFLGIVDINAKKISKIVKDKEALFIVKFDPIALGLFEPPGRLDADIAVGEGQPLGLALNFGGPYLGIFATRWDAKLVRQMPGRLVGLTTDSEGRRAFTIILQTREQHIRRAKATSNITTNEALNAIAAAVYLSLLGGKGLRKLAELILYRSHYAAKKLSEIEGVTSPMLKGFFWRDFTVKFPISYNIIHKELLKKGIHGGLNIEGVLPWIGKGSALFAVTELHTKEDIDLLVNALEDIVSKASSE